MRRQARILRFAFLLIFSLVFSISCGKHTETVSDDPGVIEFRYARFDPVKSAPSIPRGLRSIDYKGRAKQQYIVQFNAPINDGLKASIEAKGAETLNYIPNNALIVEAAPGVVASIQSMPEVRWVGDMAPAYKVALELIDGTDYPRKIRVQARITEDFQYFTASISAAGIKIFRAERGVYHNYVVIDAASSADLESVAAMPEVEWIEPEPIYEQTNDSSKWIVQSYHEGQTPLWNQGLSGADQIVGTADGGVDADSCFFYDPSQGLPTGRVNADQRKIILYHDWAGNGKWDENGHGTHTAGSIAGDSSISLGKPDTYDGMAYGAKLVIQDVFNISWGGPNDISLLFTEAYWAGARIHSNSWGSTGLYTYNTDAQAVDQFMWNNKDFLILFSAGNAGSKTGTIQAPATAKNLVSSGAAENAHTGYDTENVAVFSSNGPTLDNRIKPTVMAPGYYVNSAGGDENIGSYNCNTRRMYGTSMSCPTTAGLATLVRQYFTDGFYPTGAPNPDDALIPSAALVKATLINSARNMTGTNTDGQIPSTGQGWGEVKADDALYFAGDHHTLDVVDDNTGLSTGQTRTYTYSVDGSSRFRATLVWTDYPSVPNASIALVNNLNLTVVGPSGTYLGNVFAGGQSIIGGSADSRNVEENVYLNSPVAGTYTVTISAPSIPQGPQPFALVVTGAAKCSSDGIVRLDKDLYSLTGQVKIRLNDCDLNTNPASPDTAQALIMSSTEPVGELVTLTEISNNYGAFEGSINLAAGVPAADGKLQVSDGDTVTVTYTDVSPPGAKTDTATIDGHQPVISNVQARPDASGTTATITWDTNENSTSKVYYGLTASLGLATMSSSMVVNHEIKLYSLTPSRTYYFDVESADSVGNTKRDNNGGAHYTFNNSPPVIEVSPATISVTTYQGSEVLRSLVIRNNGTGADLGFSVSDSLGFGALTQDSFPSVALDPAKWVGSGAAVNYIGLDPPSPPYSLNLNGVDTATSVAFNATDWAVIAYEYYYERQGSGTAPGPGNSLYFEWWDGNSWVAERVHSYTDGSATSFTKIEGYLPAGAHINGLKIRFRATGDPPYSDDWAVDDVKLWAPEATWLSEEPALGKVKAGGSQTVNVIFNARGVEPGSYAANVLIANDSGDSPKAVSTVMTVVSSPDIAFDSVLLDDNSTGRSSGDGDGLLEPFEIAELWVTLANSGGSDASGVTASISSDNPNITILDADDSFGGIPSYFTATGATAFLVMVSPLTPDGSEIPIELMISDGAHQWQATFSIDVRNRSSVTGQVTRQPGGLPFAGATVHYIGPTIGEVTTNLSGSYTITDLTGGEYEVWASATGMMDSASLNVTTPPSRSGINFALQASPGITGKVTAVAGGTPISGATIIYTGPVDGTATSDVNGDYSIQNLQAGQYVIRVNATGFSPSAPTTVSLPPDAASVDFALTGRYGISGIVKDQNTGLPIVEATITWTGPSSGSVLTTTGGVFSFTGIKAGTYALRATAFAYNPSGTTYITVPPDASGVVINIVPYSTISGTVIDNNTSLPVYNATVVYSGPTSGSVKSNVSGVYTIISRPGGKYTLYAYKTGYTNSPSVYVTVPPNATGIVLALQPPNIVVTPTSISATLPPNIIDHRFVQISNTGSSNLSFTATSGGFSDDMECGQGAWQHSGTSDDWELGTPTLVGPPGPHSGTKCWGTDLDDSYNDNGDYWLRSPPIDLNGFSDATLTYWHWYWFESGYDHGYLEISTDGGVNWITLTDFSGFQDSWKQAVVSLKTYVGKVVYLRFHVVTDGSANFPGWYVDDIRVFNPTKPNWLSVSPVCGSVSPANVKALDLKINTADLADGAYSTRLSINSNDPDSGGVSVPISIDISAGRPHAGFVSYIVDDDSSGLSLGNGNGWPEAGEKVELPVTIRNDGPPDIPNVTGTMTSMDAYVTIINGAQNFGAVTSGAEATGLPGFALGISPSFPSGHTAPLLINFTDGTYTWQGMIYINIDPIPDISISPTSLSASARENSLTMVEQTLNISNTGRAALSFKTRTTGGISTSIVFQDDMESGTNGWTHAVVNSGAPDQWTLSTARPSSGTKSWHSGQDPNAVGSAALISPSIDLSQLSDTTMSFKHWYSFDDCGNPVFEADGGVVEVSSDGGITWTQVFPGGGYPYMMNDNRCGTYNPLYTLDVYAHASIGWESQTYDLREYAGKSIKIRFRVGWDCGYCTRTEGWYIDDVKVQGTSNELSWLALLPKSGTVGAFSNLADKVTFNPTVLSAGVYHGTIIVESNDSDESPISVPVTFIVNPAPKISIGSFIVDDDGAAPSSGNGNGVIEAGESIEMSVGLLNTGHLASGAITGTLSTTTAGVSIVAANSSWNNIDPGASGTSLTAFVYSVAAGFTGESISFKLDLTADGTGDVFNLTFIVPVSRVPRVDVSSPSVSVTVLEGESASRTITVSNLGSANLSVFLGEAPDASWFEFAPAFFILAPMTSQDVQLSLGASTLGAGIYTTDLLVFSNDPGSPVITVPVSLDVLPASNVIAAGLAVDDDSLGASSGDGDGYAEQGERIELGISLTNDGSVTAPGATATLTSLDNRAAVLVNQAIYGDIDPGATATSFSYVIKLDTAIPDGTILPFDLDITLSDGRFFRRGFNLVITGYYQATGSVTETLSGIPLAGAVVAWSKMGGPSGQVIAGVGGAFSISSLPAGDYTLSVSKAGYVSKDVPLNVPPDHQVLDVTLDGPVADISPASITAYLMLNGSGQANDIVHIANQGAATLNYSIVLFDDTSVPLGGPDSFGYRFHDDTSFGGPTPAFIDISADGAAIPGMGDDTNSGPIDIGFAFPFYGELFSAVYVCSNGWISFSDNGTAFGNRPLPDPLAPRNMIAPFWTDLDLTLGGQVFHRTDASGMVIEFLNVMGQLGTGPYTFEVVLTPSGAIRFEYLETQSSDIVTAGIQNSYGTDGLTIVNKQPYIADGVSVLIAPGVAWMTASPMSGAVASASNDDVALSFDLRGINLSEREYHGRIAVSSNDPEDSPWEVPVTLILDNAPSITSIAILTAAENSAYSYDVDAFDPEGDTLAYSLELFPVGMSIDGLTGLITWIPAWADVGDNDVTVLVSDGKGGGARQSFTIAVTFQDNDGDGLPDTWEVAHGLNPNSSIGDDGADGDPDHDGLTNIKEYLLGLDPTTSNAPNAPSLNYPAEASEVADLTPGLSVNNASDPDGDPLTYEFEVYADAGLVIPVVSVAGITPGVATTSWEVPLPLTDHNWYYWRARASDGLTVAPWMTWASFRVNVANEPPGTPTISSPADGGLAASVSPTLEVTETSDPDGDALMYYFRLFDDSGHSTLLEASPAVPSTGSGAVSWTVTGPLAEDRWYYWIAWAVDGHSLAGAAAPGRFMVDVTNDPPIGLAINYPAAGAELTTLTPALIVSNAIDPESAPLGYHFQIDSSPAFDSPALIDSGYVAETAGFTGFTPPVLNDNTTYYWRARADDGALTSYWVSSNFKVNLANDPPSTPTPVDPADGGQVTVLQPTLTAMPANDLDGDTLHYRFRVCSDAAMTTQVAASGDVVSGGGAISWTLDTVLTDGLPFYWQVWAVDEHGLAGGASAVQSFTVARGNSAPYGVAAVAPTGGVIIGLAQPSLIVTNGTDPDGDALSYDFEIYSDAELTALVARKTRVSEGTSQTSWQVSQSLVGGYGYYWRARAYDGLLYSPWSATAAFIVQGAAAPASSSDGGGGGGGCAMAGDGNFNNPIGVLAIMAVAGIAWIFRRRIFRVARR